MYVNPHTTRLAWRYVFLNIHTEWGSPLSYGPRFAHTLFAFILVLQKKNTRFVCVYLKNFLGLTAIQTHWYWSAPPPPLGIYQSIFPLPQLVIMVNVHVHSWYIVHFVRGGRKSPIQSCNAHLRGCCLQHTKRQLFDHRN